MGYDMYIERKQELPPKKIIVNGNELDETGYFRLNIFGMSNYREVMWSLEMVYEAPYDPDRELEAEDPDEDGIPTYKLGSNDGWLVTERECRTALERLRSPHGVQAMATLTPEQRETVADDYWQQWIEYLELASKHGGFRVY